MPLASICRTTFSEAVNRDCLTKFFWYPLLLEGRHPVIRVNIFVDAFCHPCYSKILLRKLDNHFVALAGKTFLCSVIKTFEKMALYFPLAPPHLGYVLVIIYQSWEIVFHSIRYGCGNFPSQFFEQGFF